MYSEINAVILAAGKGSRLVTRGVIKPLIKINGKLLITYIIDNLIYCGVTQFVIVKYKYDSFSELVDYYKKQKISIRLVDDAKQIGSLYTFSLAEKYVKDVFICVDCDLITKAQDLSKMLENGLSKMRKSELMGVTAKVLEPSKYDINMLILKDNKVLHFNKLGENCAVRGGYIFLWRKKVFEDCHKFIIEKEYSLSKYWNFIVENYEVETMDIVDLWDVDEPNDITYTENSISG